MIARVLVSNVDLGRLLALTSMLRGFDVGGMVVGMIAS